MAPSQAAASYTTGEYGTIKPLKPAVDLSTVGGPGEGALNIIIWGGYAEERPERPRVRLGQAVPGRDRLQGQHEGRQHVRRDGHADAPGRHATTASARRATRPCGSSPTATSRPSTPPRSPASATSRRSCRTPRTTSSTASTTARRTAGAATRCSTAPTSVTPAPTSWNVVFDPTAAAPYAGKITAYDSPIYIADAAVYLKAHNPELGHHRSVRADPAAVRRRGRTCSSSSARGSASTGPPTPTRSTTSPTAPPPSARRGRTSTTPSSRPASPSARSSRPRA